MATVTICVVLLAGVLCVCSQPAVPAQGDDPPPVSGTDSGALPPGKNEAASPGQVLLFDRLDNETESKRPEGERYVWEHELENGQTVSEKATTQNGSSVIVVKSRDRALEGYNITRSTSVYAFSYLNSVVAVIPWRRSGPCLVRNTTLTYQSAIDMLTARNGTVVRSLPKISMDGNVAPLSTDDKTTFLEANSQLRRACGPRQIIVTTELGDNKAPFSNSTEQIVTFSLEAEVSITVPERPKTDDGPRRSGNRWDAKTV